MRSRMLAILFLMSAPLTMAEEGIGLEEHVQITLDRGDYQPGPMDDRTPLILRLKQIKPAENGRFTYLFYYLSFEPGRYKLADYLIHPDGTPAMDLGETPIEISSMLPPDFQGALNPLFPRAFPALGGYRMILGGLAVLELCGLPALVWLRWKKPVAAVKDEIVPTPTYAERMQPLVKAATGNLAASGQAMLERLLNGYWREKIARPEQRMGEALSALKLHPEAGGALLRALERWLHHPGGASRAEIEKLLEPYRQTNMSVTQEVGA